MKTMMSRALRCAVITLAFSLGSCASQYQAESFLNLTEGGFSEIELESGLWRVTFQSNPETTDETVQVYWLYRCAELAIQKSFDGFAILSPVRLTSNEGRVDPLLHSAAIVIIPIPGPPMLQGSSPRFEADIRLLKKPIRGQPPRVFDALALKAALEPYVTGKKCENDNVCPHTHDYLDPPPT
jgi:hypothetical protein